MRRIYLDNNAATPLLPLVRKEYERALRECWGNPSSNHQEGQRAKGLLEAARNRIAKAFALPSSGVYFFSSATEALNTLIRGMLLPKEGKGHIITSSAEHAAVYECCRALEKEGHEVTFLKPHFLGALLPSQVEEAIRPSTTGIALMSCNNETGVLTDIASIATLAKIHAIPFLVDGVAELGKHPICFQEGISAMCFASYKIHAPKGVGVAVLGKGASFRPLLYGGGQERGGRPSTENAPAIHAFSIALELSLKDLQEDMLHMCSLRDHFEKLLKKTLPQVLVNGEGERAAHTSNLAFPGVDGESLLLRLDLQGVSASHGAACASGAIEPSRVLLEMGYSRERASSSFRFSLSRLTTKKEIEKAALIIESEVKKQLKIPE